MSAGGGQDAATYYNGPLQLIRIDESGRFHLQENAVSILGQISGRLAVVGIAGLYRTGKSFLLNRLLGLQEGFELGPSVNPCTKGLWIWGQPVQLAPDYHCVLIDTEGLGSTQRTASCDMQIFSLCILLCSYLIYNSMGAIDEQAIDDLHLVLHLAKHIHVKAKKGSDVERASELSNYFPTFLWVLRDFHLRLVDEKGAAITERGYLESALQPVPGQEEKNRLREVIKDLFRDRDCVTIVRPVADEADLRNVQRLPYESLRPQFRTQVEAFVKKAYTSMRPKKIDGAFMSGAMLVNLASEYCKAINGSAVPTIQSAWTSVIQHQLRLCLKDAVQVYRSQMNDRAMQHLPMGEDQLRDIHRAAKAEALKVFLAPRFDGNDPRFREYRAELGSRVRQLYEHVRSENLSSSQRQCERLTRELYGRQIEGRLAAGGSYQSFGQLLQDWEQLRGAYAQRACGPARSEVLAAWMPARLLEAAERLWDELRAAQERRQGRPAEAEASAAGAEQRWPQERAAAPPSEAAGAQQLLPERADLERRLEEARRSAEEAALRASREKAQLVDTERTLREQMKILQERLQSSVAESRRSAHMDGGGSAVAELHSLRDAVVAMMSEVRSMDMEKKQLEMKSEHEKQLMGLERKFQRQLMDARRKNEGLIENLRQTYEDEVDRLKDQRSDLLARSNDLERELERARGEAEALRGRVTAAEGERALQRRFAENAERQAELVAAFLERCAGRGSGREPLQVLQEELGALAGGPGGGGGSPPAGGSAGTGEPGGRDGSRRGGGGGGGAPPYSAANAAVFRSVPGV
mmetsp:Transcript_10166/g.32033  ORF Transcript_10166/g.32033 Transcript_10166/m.32033 type:complete len:807 (+) Transcript_10166:113-2533(+)